MNGEQLYNAWRHEMYLRNIEVDTWDTLDIRDQESWNAIADKHTAR